MTKIRGSTQLFFVVADPVAQVKAPLVFNQIFQAEGVDAVAIPAQVTASNLNGFVREALALGNAAGLLVSIPHKTALARLVSKRDPVAEMAGSVNALKRSAQGELEGALFDGAGFLGAMRHHDIGLAGRRALLVGAGGAGLAIAAALVAMPMSALQVYDPEPGRADQLVQRVAPHASFPVTAAAQNHADGFDLVINATPLGMKETDALPFNPDVLTSQATVVDILMMAQPTPLLRACAERGLQAVPGHEMLLQQVPAYLDFFDMPEIAHSLRKPSSVLMQQLRATIHGQMAV